MFCRRAQIPAVVNGIILKKKTNTFSKLLIWDFQIIPRTLHVAWLIVCLRHLAQPATMMALTSGVPWGRGRGDFNPLPEIPKF
jgi:hypothetical protein